MTTRIEPAQPPYPADVAATLAAVTSPGREPIRIFRTFAGNPAMAVAMGEWGRYELSDRLSLPLRDREIVIQRTCARCRCEYEWGVHVAVFAERAGVSRPQVASLAHGAASDPCWDDERDRVLIEAADALHDGAAIDDALWARLSARLRDEQLLDLLMLAGWYHAICFTANGAGIAREDGAPRFADLLEPSA
jgi:alkylhydroperoxidase family enzyme